ncbi:hypothetical protein EVAR_24604_1 [Eumeta japonica]|uniref:Uncharacterized protein n=1 Tax=Eumeta variegata TaxID=151549 RepID=A0A4C1W3T7_EUMVA|nr:hypothetical protein EVAR_24604_1 [Eumeta japonica]
MADSGIVWKAIHRFLRVQYASAAKGETFSGVPLLNVTKAVYPPRDLPRALTRLSRRCIHKVGGVIAAVTRPTSRPAPAPRGWRAPRPRVVFFVAVTECRL